MKPDKLPFDRFDLSLRNEESTAPLPDTPSHRFAQRAASSAEQRSGWIERGTSAFRRMTVAFFFAGFAIFALLYCVQPLLPLFARDFEVSPAASALTLSLAMALLAPSILCAAALSEGVGRRGLMFISMASTACLNIAAGFAPNWPLILLIRALEGVALGGAPAVAMTYLAEEIHPRGLGLAMGLYIAGTAFGGMMGRLIAGMLTQAFSWRVAMAGLGGAGLGAALVFLFLLPHSRNFRRGATLDLRYHASAWWKHFTNPALRLVFAVGFLEMGAFVCLYNFAGFRLTRPPFDLDQRQLGFVFTVYLFGMVASWRAGSLADRIGRAAVLPAGIAITAVGVGLTLLPGLAAMITGIVFITVGFFATHAVASGWVGRLAQSARGHAASLYLLAYYIGASMLGAAGGWFWAKGGWEAVAAFTFVALGLAFAAALRLRQAAAGHRGFSDLRDR